MDKKRYILIGASAVLIVILGVLFYGSNAAFRTSGSPTITNYEFGDLSLPIKGYGGSYNDMEVLVGNIEEITLYYAENELMVEYLKTVDYNIHPQKLGFFDKFMIFLHGKGTSDNPIVLVEEGDLSISVVRENVFVIKAQSTEELKKLFTYASEHVYDLSTDPYEIEIPFGFQGEEFNLSVFSAVNQGALSQSPNMIFSVIRSPLVNTDAERLYLFHTPWEEKGKENSKLAKGLGYISEMCGRLRPEMVNPTGNTLVIADLTLLDKFMLHMEIMGNEDSPVYCVRTAVDNAEEDGIYIPREGFLYLEVANYEDIEKYCMGLRQILGGS
ncbi:MAG: hypothetical protein U9N35_02360 [Euryarchaeota archaeon]|nr:hypothetical protein [Euryarchaeota archaeon]